MSENARLLMDREEMTWEHEWSKVLTTGVLSK
jgi:hypothetical protein